MKYLYLLLFFISNTAVFAEMDTIEIHFFDNGNLSTMKTKSGMIGKAIAYNIKGEIIYQKEIRSFAGHASVYFSHHPNGAVKTANYSTAPDAGIQWYKSTTEFSPDGEITNKTVRSHDMRERIIQTYIVETGPENDELEPDVQEEDTTFVQEIMECASIHQNKISLVNHTPYELFIYFVYQREKYEYTLSSGEKMEAFTYISAEISNPPGDNLQFGYVSLNTSNKADLSHLMTVYSVNKLKTIYTFHLIESKVKN
ncbi:MAG: hypothetical protein EA412_05850 [Chitinophagaceae bacterium]|nr:MAG: hypothetical protein EA412_05850 [Chitinophagaceae bacterium]